jgi:vancomycin resistance protein YoaR
MDTVRTLRKPEDAYKDLLRRILIAAGGGVAALLAVLFVFLVGVRLVFWDRALPGVRAAGISLTGMDQEQIVEALRQELTYPQTGWVLLSDGDQAWSARPAELGISIDYQAMADQALAVGREGVIFGWGDQLAAWYSGRSISPIVLFDRLVGSFYLSDLAAQIDQPMLEASLRVVGTGIEAAPGQVGRRVDIPLTLDLLAVPAAHLRDAEVPLVIVETHPRVVDASTEAETARRILTQPLTITADEGEEWVIQPYEMADMMQFEIVDDETSGARYSIGLDPMALYAFLEPLAPDLERRAENARFIFNDDTGQLDLLSEAVDGRSLNFPESIRSINEQLLDGGHTVALVFDTETPQVTSEATAEELGISEAVSVVSSYFYGSSSARVQNIRTASSAFHGLLLAPGETLSMAEVLGDISLDNGYAEALIIYGDRTIKGVGGGVCQVSTTLFRAVFFGGYQIEERHPHAYRVSYYEQGPGSPGPGLDATVFVPLVDFRFTNDSDNWLLLETYVYGNQLLWKFYSTSDGRVVDWSSDEGNRVEAPDPLYRENEELDEGEIEQIDYEADGLDVVVYRTVTLNGEVLHEDIIKTHYLPWRAIYEYGPGTELPEDAVTEESE